MLGLEGYRIVLICNYLIASYPTLYLLAMRAVKRKFSVKGKRFRVRSTPILSYNPFNSLYFKLAMLSALSDLHDQYK